MCTRCLAASFRPKSDPTKSKRLEDAYVRKILPLFDKYERAIIAAFESRAREMSAPVVGIPLDWFATRLTEIAEAEILDIASQWTRGIIKNSYVQGVTWADLAIKQVAIGGKIGAGPIDWRALDVLEARNLTALKGITDAVSKEIVATLTEGLLNGEGIPKLRNRIADCVDTIGRKRAETMARTETMFAVNNGATIRYAQAGIARVRFLAGLDERVCEECEGEHGNEYEIGEEPSLPLHPNCRCTWVPVVEVPD